MEVPPFLLCCGTHALALLGPLTRYYCSVDLVRSDCKVLGCKSQAAAICCLSASLSLFSTPQLVERYVCQLAVHAAGGRGLAQGWWLVCSAPSMLCLLVVSCLELLHLCLEGMVFIVMQMWSRNNYFSRFLFDSLVWILHCFQLLAFTGAIQAKWGVFTHHKKILHSALYWDLSEDPKAWYHNPWHRKGSYHFDTEKLKKGLAPNHPGSWRHTQMHSGVLTTSHSSMKYRLEIYHVPECNSTWEYWNK